MMSSASATNKQIDSDELKLIEFKHEVTILGGLYEFCVKFYGPKDTPYDGGVWKVKVELPEKYPFKSPSIGFTNRIYHPNIDEVSGTVCLDVINQSWSGLYDISNIIEQSITTLMALEDKINSYNTVSRGTKETVFQIQEKEHAGQVQSKNFSDTCSMIEELVENLKIDDEIKVILLDGKLNDESRIEKALNELERVLNYNPDPILEQMKCVQEQRAHAATIKTKFCNRFYDHFTRHVDNLLSEYYDSFSDSQAITMPGHHIIQKNLEHWQPIVSWLSRNDRSTYQAINNFYPEVLIRVKRNFDNFMKQQLTTIRELKAPKQPKCDILSVVKNFEQFANQVESLIKSTGARRSDIDRWYLELVTELFNTIDRIEHSRTPTEMIRLENYDYLHNVLRSIKVPCLEAQTKEAKMQYEAARDAYVARYFGRPLEKVNIFFEGVQAKVAQGVKEEEISFQLAFSKQELRKVLQMVTLKEVRKGLEEMYRRIEKHASDPDSNLIQVIWHAMQEEFLSQYKALQGMIERCYPGSNLGLTFTIDNVLEVFSDIAQSH